MDLSDLSRLVRDFLYYPEPLPVDEPPPLWAGNGEEVWMRCEDGIRIHGLWWNDPPDAPVILFLHGNAQEVYSWSPVNQELKALGCRMLLIDFHGYGKSGGEPSEQNLYLDGEAAMAWLKGRGVEDSDIIVFGKSLGGGVACEIARNHGIRALILESTFTSLASVGRKLFPFLPPGLELGEVYDSINKVRVCGCPVMVIHGDADDLIPVGEGRGLYEAAPGRKDIFLVPGAGHNDVSMVAGPDYTRRISAFLNL
jgi:fermentation-respiration switch protein FrsA (DUF1100 family)